jgi:hypothetical protein
MRRPIDLRVSDADREDVADVLKRHYLAGRLSEGEFDARVDGAYAARYESELVALLRDLPAATEARPAPAAPQRYRPGLGLVTGGTVAVAVAAILIANPEGAVLGLGLAAFVAIVLAVAVAPVAVPLALVAWIAHALTRPRPPRQITLPPPPGPRRF